MSPRGSTEPARRPSEPARSPSEPARSPDELWADPRHWRAGGIYRCPEDPRLVVPKRVRWAGYTVNFAHAAAWPALAAIVLAVLAPFALALVFPFPEALLWIAGAFAAAVVALVAVCHWESTRRR